MFDWLTFSALEAAMVDWFGVISIPVAMILGLLVTMWGVSFVVDLFRARKSRDPYQPPSS